MLSGPLHRHDTNKRTFFKTKLITKGMEWITVKTEKDLPNERHLHDEEAKYVVRVFHDDRGSHIEELTEDEIWEAARTEDGAVCWLKEK